jgi:hypothetical protein
VTLREDLDAAEDALKEASIIANAIYSKATAGAKREYDLAVARIESEYQSKRREALAELALVERKVRAQLSDFKRVRDAMVRAEERNLASIRRPASQVRSHALAHLRTMRDEARTRFWQHQNQNPPRATVPRSSDAGDRDSER